MVIINLLPGFLLPKRNIWGGGAGNNHGRLPALESGKSHPYV